MSNRVETHPIRFGGLALLAYAAASAAYLWPRDSKVLQNIENVLRRSKAF